MKIGMLEKKIELADAECDKKVCVEREEQDRLRSVMDEQERCSTVHTHTHTHTHSHCTGSSTKPLRFCKVTLKPWKLTKIL